MSTIESAAPRGAKRREDFPVESFQYLEAKLQELRRIVMNRAAEIAAVMDSHPEVYHVEKRHIDEALAQFLSDPDTAQQQLGTSRLQ